MGIGLEHTKVIFAITPTFPAFMWFSTWAMLEWLVSISNVIEEMLKAMWQKWSWDNGSEGLGYQRTIWLLFKNRDAARLWTGASPQRWFTDKVSEARPNENRRQYAPRNKSHPCYPETRRIWYKRGFSRTPNLQFQSCSRLTLHLRMSFVIEENDERTMTKVICFPIVIRKEAHGVIWCDNFWIFVYKLCEAIRE